MGAREEPAAEATPNLCRAHQASNARIVSPHSRPVHHRVPWVAVHRPGGLLGKIMGHSGETVARKFTGKAGGWPWAGAVWSATLGEWGRFRCPLNTGRSTHLGSRSHSYKKLFTARHRPAITAQISEAPPPGTRPTGNEGSAPEKAASLVFRTLSRFRQPREHRPLRSSLPSCA
jgi:hypothetical protein